MAGCTSENTRTTKYRALELPPVDRPCPSCGHELPQSATFCTECGLCLLAGGTSVAPKPTATQPMAAVLELPNEEELDLSDVEIVEEIELDVDFG